MVKRRKTDAPRKPINLLEIGGGKHLTLAAKSAVLTDLKALGYIPQDQACSARQITRCRKEAATRSTDFGRLIVHKEFQTTDGPVLFPLQNPLAMLTIALAEGPRFAGYVRSAIARFGLPSPDAPWSIILYVDEVTCGQPLAVKADGRRKVQGVYWSIYQLGAQALADDSSWFELAAFRAVTADGFDGSVSHMLDVCLSCFFAREHNIRHCCRFELLEHGGFMLCLALEMLIADIPALVSAIGANGVSAILPCFLCRRVLSFKANAELTSLEGFVDLSCTDLALGRPHTNASLTKLLRGLEEAKATLGTTELKRKITLCGYKPIPNNFLMNAHQVSRPIDIIHPDWMHLMFQTGNWNRETFQIMRAATTRQTDAYALLTEYVANFSFPAARKLRRNTLSPKHWDSCKDATVFKTSASDGLTLYAVVGKFCQDVLLPRFAGAKLAELTLMMTSYNCLSDVVDLLQLSLHGLEIDPDLLDQKCQAWRRAHEAAYGVALTYLKTHLTSHLAKVLRARMVNRERQLAMLFACFALDYSICNAYMMCIYDSAWARCFSNARARRTCTSIYMPCTRSATTNTSADM